MDEKAKRKRKHRTEVVWPSRRKKRADRDKREVDPKMDYRDLDRRLEEEEND